ncbi:MAG: VOC family protein [Bdellovibrionaceae bacterium]|nr:VOC family protein [Pseudobdellovibrionaceae bacterium]
MNYTTGKMEWFDFPITDETKSLSFFEKLFNWHFTPMGLGYWMIEIDDQHIGALRKSDTRTNNTEHAFVPYFTVPSIKEAVSLLQKLGGQVDEPTVAIRDGADGYFQRFTDLDGNLLSLWSKKP